MLPNSYDFVPAPPQHSRDSRISIHISFDLRLPIGAVLAWHAATLFASMPKAPINKDGQTEGFKVNIWAAWNVAGMQPPTSNTLPH
jgi:hypothetical protein